MSVSYTHLKHVRENFIDITLKGVTKGDAITELIEKLGIDKKDTCLLYTSWETVFTMSFPVYILSES